MPAVEDAERYVAELRSLLAGVRSAQGRVPSLRRPTAAVGAPGSWTGKAANRLHQDEMVPLSDGLGGALNRAEQAVLDELAHAERSLSRAQDEQDAKDAENRSAS